jgi:hypothetical protein
VIARVCAYRHLKRELIRGMRKESRRQLVFRVRRVRSAAFFLLSGDFTALLSRLRVSRERHGERDCKVV